MEKQLEFRTLMPEAQSLKLRAFYPLSFFISLLHQQVIQKIIPFRSGNKDYVLSPPCSQANTVTLELNCYYFFLKVMQKEEPRSQEESKVVQPVNPRASRHVAM